MKNIEYLISNHDPEASEFRTVYSVCDSSVPECSNQC